MVHLATNMLQTEIQRRHAVEAEREENSRLLSALEDGLQSATARQAAASTRSEEDATTATPRQLSSSDARPTLVASGDRAEATVVHEQSAESNRKVRTRVAWLHVPYAAIGKGHDGRNCTAGRHKRVSCRTGG